MLMESVRGKRRPSSEPESEPKRPKSEAELGSEQEPKEFHDNLKLSNLSVYDDDDEPYMYQCDEFVYKNEAWKKLEDEDDHYIDGSRNLSASKPPLKQMDYRGTIRSMFGYNPKFVDDDDDPNMEVGFDQICKEERRSAKLAKEEDDREMRLLEEEMERERADEEESARTWVGGAASNTRTMYFNACVTHTEL